MIEKNLRTAALEIFNYALHAVDARTATRNAISIDQSNLRVKDSEFKLSSRGVYVVGLGKASVSMSLGLNDVLGERISAAVISSSAPPTSSQLPSSYRCFLGGHPFPNQQSLDAARAAFELLEKANEEKAVVVFLVSGGGSALLEWPVSDQITLADLQEANRQLVRSGATIAEINSIRRAFSAIKGGGLASRGPNAQIVTLIVSDTNPGDEASVASGPTLSSPVDSPNAETAIEKYGLVSSLPSSVLNAIRHHSPTHSPHFQDSPAYVLLDNRAALEAAREKAIDLGFKTNIEEDIVEQPVDEGSELLLARVKAHGESTFCSISGGEFSCRVAGEGRGGRNLETVLRCALKLSEDDARGGYHTVVMSAGTDGVDGSSNAAGAIADENTISRSGTLGLDPNQFLQTSDSHSFFQALGDLVVTGPTGTNVRDLRVVLRCKSVVNV